MHMDITPTFGKVTLDAATSNPGAKITTSAPSAAEVDVRMGVCSTVGIPALLYCMCTHAELDTQQNRDLRLDVRQKQNTARRAHRLTIL